MLPHTSTYFPVTLHHPWPAFLSGDSNLVGALGPRDTMPTTMVLGTSSLPCWATPGAHQGPGQKPPRVAVSCGVGRRCGSDPLLLGLWHRPAAISLIRPLAWELPYAVDAVLKSKKTKQNKTKKKQKKAGD